MIFVRLAICLRALRFAAGGAFITPLLLAENASPPPPPPAQTPGQETALAVLDRTIERFEALLERDNDTQHKTATAAVLSDFKLRRTTLRKAFDQIRYDELRVDLNLEYQRLAQWMSSPKNPPPANAKSRP